MATPQRLLRVSHAEQDAKKAPTAALSAMRSRINVNTRAGDMSVWTRASVIDWQA